MTMPRLFAAFPVGAALSVAGLMALSGCEERPYPSPSNTAPPAAKPPADLMGAPSAPSPYTAPAVPAPAYAPPPAAYAPPPAPPYDSGAVVAMAPIPNPGSPGSDGYYAGHHHRVHGHYDTAGPAPGPVIAEAPVHSPYGEGHPAPGRHPTYPTPAPVAPPVYAKATPAPAPVKPVYTPPKPVTYAKTTTTTTKTTKTVVAPALPPVKAVAAYDAKKVEHKAAVATAAAGAAAGVMAMDAKHAAIDAKKAVKAAVQTAKVAPPPAPVAPPAPVGDRATHLAALQTVLTDAVGKTAVLTAPASFTANQPADVSLTVPAGFADTLKAEAQKDGLGDAAASVNMTALLSGDGFAVTPDDMQSAPLTVGQPTEFHWTVTAQPGAKGPLHADVGADLLGGGSDKLALGSVQKAAGMGIKLTPRVIGASLLVLIAALVVAWLARGRGPTRSASARRASRRAARIGRPLDMSAPTDETPAH